MPKKRSKKAQQGDARNRMHVLQDVDPGPSSTGTRYSSDTSYNLHQDSQSSTGHLADTSQLETTSLVASGHGPSTSNNSAISNVLSGSGNIINVSSILNVQSSSGATVNLGPINNFVAPAGHVLDDVDSQHERIMSSLATLIGDRFISNALYDTLPKHAGCMPGTRQSILTRIIIWISQDPTRIFWLAGMAGTGKSSIAVTLCRMLWDDMSIMFGGSFFCSRSAGSIARTDVRNILPTLVNTLASQNPEFAVALAAILKKNPRATQRPVSDQIDVLLVKTFEEISPFNHPIIFVIDGLDECTDEREVAELLTAIADLKINPNVKFVVTSRPEMHIRGTSISNPDHNTILQLHTIKKEEVTIDIRRYVTGTLEARAPDASWYTGVDVETLVRLSRQPKGRKERLDKAIDAATHGSAQMESLDKIYEMIVLEAARSDLVDADELLETRRVLATILAARAPLSVLAMADLLDRDVQDVHGSLERLHSVVYLPDNDREPGVRTLHASFGDYVVSRAVGHVRLPVTLGDDVLARGCLHVMTTRLHFNVSQIRSSYEPNPDTKPDTFTLSLEYACLEWIFHIAGVLDTSVWDEDISKIFRVRFLFWLEVMSVLNKVRRAAAMLIFAATTVRLTALSSFLRDANTFVASSREAIERSAAHIYLSALPFAAKDSLVYQTFAPLCTGLISVEAIGVDQHGSRLMMTLTGHGGWVNSVDCSSDGRHVVSGSDDGTVRIWDIRTGEETMPPLSCGDRIHSVAFAPDGKIFSASTYGGDVFTWSLSASHASPLWHYPSMDSQSLVTFSPDGSLAASAYLYGGVRLWQIETGNILANLNCGYETSVQSVAFSPDRSKIALAFGYPGVVQLWLVATGEPLGRPFIRETHSSAALCFSLDGAILAMQGQRGCIDLLKVDDWTATATIRHGTTDLKVILFSPDGRSIASASYDGNVHFSTISVEGAASPPAVLSGHTDWVNSAAFSHDGSYIVSCSNDCTIRLWNAGGSLRTAETLPTHGGRISTVTTSSDGTLIVSGSHDRSVRVWSADTGASRLPPLLGHTDAVLSVAISHDSFMIASASADGTVRLWNSRDGQAIGNPLTGHRGAVNSVSFSPNTLWLISGSDDRSVRIWDAAIGGPTGPRELSCSGTVLTVAFSPDGLLFAAGEKHGCIHLWHAATGQPLCAPLENPEGNLHSICFSSDSARIVSGGHKGKVAIWDVATRMELFARRSADGWVTAVAFSHDSTLICSGSSVDNFVRIRSAIAGKDVKKLDGHTGGVNSLALRPNGRSLVSASDDRTIRVWDLAVARPRPPADHSDTTLPLAFTTLKEGWLVNLSKDLLLWVPREYRKHRPIWPCTMLITDQCVNIAVGNEGWHRGTSWTSCWLQDAWKTLSSS